MSNRPLTLALCAHAISEDGHGIALAPKSGREIWIPDLLPQEHARVEILHDSQHRKRSWGRIVERIGTPSPDRVTPPCPAHGLCGGCAWQHMSSGLQRQHKRQRVQRSLRTQLEHATKVPLPAQSSLVAYRNKGKYVVARQDGQIVLGAYKPRSHEVVSTLGCQIVQEPIDTTARKVAQLSNTLATEIYEDSGEGGRGLRYVVLRCNAIGEVLVLLICTSDTASGAIQDLANSLLATGPVTGVLRCDNDLKSGALLTQRIIPVCGSTSLTESISNVTIELGPGEFWQLNREQAARAFGELADGLALYLGERSPAPIVELYCGTGAISFVLAQRGYHVMGIDSDAEAIRSATEAARNAGLCDRLSFETGDAANIAGDRLATAGAVIVDPPRKGLGPAGRELLIKARPPLIAYLSCGPSSLATDLAALVEAGYQVLEVRLYDFMPGTSQVESLVFLRRLVAPANDKTV